jgi:ubiquinone/menaquinone biosynthesis C-methylase UbiE
VPHNAIDPKVSDVRFESADAQTLPFPPRSFDLVLSRFGIMFFDDPEAAFSNFRQALRPSGRLSFVAGRRRRTTIS